MVDDGGLVAGAEIGESGVLLFSRIGAGGVLLFSGIGSGGFLLMSRIGSVGVLLFSRIGSGGILLMSRIGAGGFLLFSRIGAGGFLLVSRMLDGRIREGHFFEAVAEAGFEAGEAEGGVTGAGAFAEGAGEIEAARVAGSGEFFNERAAGIREAEEFCALVEGFAGGVVDGAVEDGEADAVLLVGRIEAVEEGVAAGDEQAEVREQGREVVPEAGGVLGVEGDERRPDVAAEVVDADEGEVAGEREGFAEGDAQGEAAGEAGALRDGDLGDAGVFGLGGGEGEQGGQAVEVFAAGEVGDDAAVFAVEGDLAVNPFAGEAAGGVEEGEGRFVARAFDGENHGVEGALGRGRKKWSPAARTMATAV